MKTGATLLLALALAGAGCAYGGPTESFGTLVGDGLETDPGKQPARELRADSAPASAVAPAGTVAPNGEEPFHHAEPLYAVVLVEADDVLNVRAEPGATAPVVDRLAPESTEVTGTGRTAYVGEARWVEVLAPAATGWVNARYLTELVAPEAFCADPRVGDLLADLSRALRTEDGERLFALTSPAHGLTIHLVPGTTGVHFDDVEVRDLFAAAETKDWGVHPYSGEPIEGAFKETVLPSLRDAVTAAATVRECNELVTGAAAYRATLPVGHANFNFYTLHVPGTDAHERMDWQSWVVAIDYVEGHPYVVALHRFAR